MSEHQFQDHCTCDPHKDIPTYDCLFCAGLSYCVLCSGFEGSMPTECPGNKEWRQLLDPFDGPDLVYAGVKDFRHGEWVDHPNLAMWHANVTHYATCAECNSMLVPEAREWVAKKTGLKVVKS
jgi:hypothetical protein